MTGLRLEGVTKSYGDVAALSGVDLEVAEGELLVVLGPSGSGKTTLLRVTAGLEPPTSGQVTIRDRDVTSLSPGRRNVAMVFQGYALFPHMTVAENIAFGLVVRDVPRSEIESRVQTAAELVGVERLLGRRPHEMSGGERQRIALARALVREPDVFLFDEPLSNLDPELRVGVRDELRRLHDEVGGTTLHVTHDQVEALILGDRIAVLRDGLLQQVGTADEIWKRPANRFVARFVGTPTMNIVSANGPFRLERLPASELDLGIRPEDVTLEAGGTPARVTRVDSVGADAYIHVDAGGTSLVSRVSGEARPTPGDEVGVSVDPQRVHLFDPVTGERVEWS